SDRPERPCLEPRSPRPMPGLQSPPSYGRMPAASASAGAWRQCMAIEQSGRPGPDLSGQVVLITGAGRGLGRSLALHLSRCGAKVGLSDIDPDSCRQTADLVAKEGGTAWPLPADLSSQAAFEQVAADLAKAAGRI